MQSNPGTTKLEHLKEDLGAADIVLSPDDLQRIESACSEIEVRGARTSEALLKQSDGMM